MSITMSTYSVDKILHIVCPKASDASSQVFQHSLMPAFQVSLHSCVQLAQLKFNSNITHLVTLVRWLFKVVSGNLFLIHVLKKNQPWKCSLPFSTISDLINCIMMQVTLIWPSRLTGHYYIYLSIYSMWYQLICFWYLYYKRQPWKYCLPFNNLWLINCTMMQVTLIWLDGWLGVIYLSKYLSIYHDAIYCIFPLVYCSSYFLVDFILYLCTCKCTQHSSTWGIKVKHINQTFIRKQTYTNIIWKRKQKYRTPKK